MNEELIHKIGRILAIPPRHVENMTFVKIIEALVSEFGNPSEKPKRRVYSGRDKKYKVLWDKELKHIAAVDIRTYYRRIDVNQMTPYEAATIPRRNGNQFSLKGE